MVKKTIDIFWKFMEKLNINYVSIEWSVAFKCRKIYNINVTLL